MKKLATKTSCLVALICCVALSIGYLPTPAVASTVANGSCGDNLYWELDNDGQLYITGSGDMYDWEGSSELPWASNKDDIKTLVVSDGVTRIGNYAFDACMSLTDITLPGSLSSIGEFSFGYCDVLSSLVIPSGVVSIGEYSFAGCLSLSKVTIPKSLINIGDAAFVMDISLTDVYYAGTQSEWNKITIGKSNDELTSATIHYNSNGAVTSNPSTKSLAKQTIKSKSSIKVKRGKKTTIKVNGAKTSLAVVVGQKAKKALKATPKGTNKVTVKCLKKAKKGKSFKIKIYAKAAGNYAKSNVRSVKIKVR